MEAVMMLVAKGITGKLSTDRFSSDGATGDAKNGRGLDFCC